MKVLIQNFKKHKDLEIEGNKIIISGKNGEGKSSVLEAIEYILFGTINGKSTGIKDYIKDGTENFILGLEIGNQVYTASSVEKYNGALPKYLRDVYFCNLLNAQPIQIRETLIKILKEEDIKEKVGDYRKGDIDKTIKHIKKLYRDYKKNYQSIANKIQVITSQLDELKNIDESDLDKLDKQIQQQENMLEALGFNENEPSLLDKELQKLREELQEIIYKYNKAKTGVCPTCLQPLKDAIPLLNKLKEQYSKKKKEYDNLMLEYEALQKRIKQLEEDEYYISEKQKLNELKEKYKQLYANLEMKNKLKQELSKLSILISEMNSDIEDIYLYIKEGIYQEISEIISKAIPNIEITFFKKSSWKQEDNLTFLLTYKGIEYKNLSNSEKIYVNMLLSKFLFNFIPHEKILLIDNVESFDKNNLNKLLKDLDNYNYILTKVSNTKLTIKPAAAGK